MGAAESEAGDVMKEKSRWDSIAGGRSETGSLDGPLFKLWVALSVHSSRPSEVTAGRRKGLELKRPPTGTMALPIADAPPRVLALSGSVDDEPTALEEVAAAAAAAKELSSPVFG